MIKVIMVILFIIVGLIYDWGGINGHPGPVCPFIVFTFSQLKSFMEGLSNFHNNQAFVGGISAFASNVAVMLDSFGGVELVAVAAGESLKPNKSVPRATRATFYRIVLFYILMILTIKLCINQNDPTLLNANSKYLQPFYYLFQHIKRSRWLGNTDASASPVTVVFLRAGFGPATHVVNAVLLTAVLSVTNSCYYASSRMLWAMAKSGQAPRIFGVVNKRGVPVPALL
jgi:amino acid permease